MPKMSQHKAATIAKMLILGDSGAGKTSSLISLVEAGYKLRIIDLDSGLDILSHLIKQRCPDKIDNVEFVSLRDTYKAKGAAALKPTPKTWVELSKLLGEWEDGTKPEEWGGEYILVIDSLTAAGKAALSWATGMNPTAKDRRQHYGAAQESIDNMLDLLTSSEFNTNLIIITHVKMIENDQGLVKEVPTAVGTSLSTQMGKYFNTIVNVSKSGSGEKVRREIRTVPTATMDLKSSNPSVKPKFDHETGLAELFAELRK